MTQPLHGRLPAALVLGVLLAACAGPPPPTGGDRMDGASLSQPLRPATTAPSDPAVAAVPVPSPAAPAPARRSAGGPKPGAIIDHPGTTVRTLLGAPALRRREPPAEVWQYSGEGCVLDITFYPGKDGGPPRAAYLESRTLDGTSLEAAACLGQITPERR